MIKKRGVLKANLRSKYGRVAIDSSHERNSTRERKKLNDDAKLHDTKEDINDIDESNYHIQSLVPVFDTDKTNHKKKHYKVAERVDIAKRSSISSKKRVHNERIKVQQHIENIKRNLHTISSINEWFQDDNIPSDVIYHIFQYLRPEELLEMYKVCKRWRNLLFGIKDEVEKFFKKMFIEECRKGILVNKSLGSLHAIGDEENVEEFEISLCTTHSSENEDIMVDDTRESKGGFALNLRTIKEKLPDEIKHEEDDKFKVGLSSKEQKLADMLTEMDEESDQQNRIERDEDQEDLMDIDSGYANSVVPSTDKLLEHQKKREYNESWRMRYFIRHCCLKRLREALYHFILFEFLNESMDSYVGVLEKERSHDWNKNERKKTNLEKCKEWRQLIGWYQLDETEKRLFVESCLKEAENFGKIDIYDKGKTTNKKPIIEEYWIGNCVAYMGRIVNTSLEIHVYKGKKTVVHLDDCNWSKQSMDGNTLSLSFVDNCQKETTKMK